MQKVLVVGIDQEITPTIERLINGLENYQGRACGSMEEMVEFLHTIKYDILLIGAGFDQKQEQEMQKRAKEIQPDLEILEHYGGGSGLLLSELEALKQK